MADYRSLTDPLRAKVDERFKREFRVDPNYEETLRRVNEGLAGLTSQEEQGKRRLDEDYASSMRQAGESHEQNIKALQERLANQGILRSGINVGEQGRYGQEYQKVQEGLGQAKSRGTEDMVRELTAQRQNLETERRLAESNRARSEAEFRDTLAREEAETEANERFKQQQAQELETLKNKVLELSQPKPTPTGQLVPPPPPPPMPAPLPKMPAMPAIPRATDSGAVQAMGINPVDLQKHLQIRGFDPGQIDGRIGAKTHRALIMWKQSVGLPPTIDFGPNEWNILRSSGIGNVAAGSRDAVNTGSMSLGKFPQAGPARASMS